eukprot:scaffold101073_cov18-Prasinocladus_malaysianus.AAC.1
MPYCSNYGVRCPSETFVMTPRCHRTSPIQFADNIQRAQRFRAGRQQSKRVIRVRVVATRYPV